MDGAQNSWSQGNVLMIIPPAYLWGSRPQFCSAHTDSIETPHFETYNLPSYIPTDSRACSKAAVGKFYHSHFLFSMRWGKKAVRGNVHIRRVLCANAGWTRRVPLKFQLALLNDKTGLRDAPLLRFSSTQAFQSREIIGSISFYPPLTPSPLSPWKHLCACY